MRRISVQPRSGWKARCESIGFRFHSVEAGAYWDESAAYVLRDIEVELLDAATQSLYDMSLQAVQHVIDNGRYADLKIPGAAIPLIEDSWNRETPSVYSRFDLAWGGVGTGPPKLLEFNAQTPTSLLETAEVQWAWKEEVVNGHDQFNSLEPKLKEQWKACKPYIIGKLYFTSAETDEDETTVQYMRSLAESVGIKTDYITIKDIGWDSVRKIYVNDQKIESIFALYPWEWLIREQSRNIARSWPGMLWMEPAWKMILSNKAILAILWELFPDSEYLLPTYLDGPRDMSSYVKKPIYSREGANVTIVDSGVTAAQSGGQYGSEGFVYQALAKLANIAGKQAVIGSWYVTDQGPAGVGFRESDGLITDNLSRFVPHYME